MASEKQPVQPKLPSVTRTVSAAPKKVSEPEPLKAKPTEHPVATLQRKAAHPENGEPTINVQLLIDGSDADGVRCYNEMLPVSVIQGLLDPTVADFFLPIRGAERLKAPRVKSHWLHTSYIREVLLLDELPG